MPDSINDNPEIIAKIQMVTLGRLGIRISEQRAKRLLFKRLTQWAQKRKRTLNDILSSLEGISDDHPLFLEFSSLVTIGDSYFFRKPAQLEALVDWMEQHCEQPVNIWSAGCSIGCEVYSLAYLLHSRQISYRILGTDIDRSRLDTAKRRGPFSPNTVRAGSPIPQNFLHEQDKVLFVSEKWSKNIFFRHHNLLSEEYPRPKTFRHRHDVWDVILCRNALMYFPEQQAHRIMTRMIKSLRPNGSLWLGDNDISFATKQIFRHQCWGEHTLFVPPRQRMIPPQTPPKPSGELLVKKAPSTTVQPPSKILLRSCLESGCYTLANKIVDDMLLAKPHDPALRLTKVAILSHLNNIEEAFQVLSLLPNTVRFRTEQVYFEGLLYLQNNDSVMATTKLQQVIEDNPEHWLAAYHLGCLGIEQNRWISAKQYCQQALQSMETTIHTDSLWQPKLANPNLSRVTTNLRGLLHRLQACTKASSPNTPLR